MANTKDRMDIVLEAIYQETQQPAIWDRPFEWKPNVAIHFKKINKQFQPIGETLKARTNGADSLWIFPAMGGKQGKGHFFDISTESGDNPKPWTSFIPVAEVFKDGKLLRILPPTGQTDTEEQAQPPGPAKPPEPGSAKPTPPAPAKTASNGEKLPPIAQNYLDQALFVPQSDSWWKIKDAVHLDGAIISNSFQYAALVCAPRDTTTEASQDEILEWATWFESNMRETKYQRIRERYTVMLGLCTKVEQVTEIVNQGWASLPKSHYDPLKEAAMMRIGEIKAGAGTPGAGTPNPEAPDPPDTKPQGE